MKKIFSVSCLIIMMISLDMPALNAQNEAQPEKKISYNMINEYGIYVGGSCGLTGVFVNSMKFNRTNDLLGIGVGYELNGGLAPQYDECISGLVQCVPLFLNYRHYFVRPEKSLAPLINIAFGPMFIFRNDYYASIPEDENTYRYTSCSLGMYGTIASGFKVKAFSLTGGFFFRSNVYDGLFTFGVETKVGFSF